MALAFVPVDAWIDLTYRVAGPGPGGGQALALAAYKCNLERVELLLEGGVPVDPPDEMLADYPGESLSSTPLHSAAAASPECVEAVDHLIALGADLERKSTSLGEPPLFAAASQGNLASLQALFAAGARLDATNEDGESVLSVAERNDQTDVVDWLRAHGIPDPSAPADKKTLP